MELLAQLRQHADQVLPTPVLLHLLKAYQRPYDKLNELVKKGYLIQLMRGFYMAGKAVDASKPEPWLIANHLYGPSYVSADSALSYHGMIPEQTYGIISASTRKRKKIITQQGNFEYFQLPLEYYSVGIQQLSVSEKQHFLIASPEKALCDAIIHTKGLFLRSKKQVRVYLMENLRIDEDFLSGLNRKQISDWASMAPKSLSLMLLAKTLEEL
jgi:hypothetical protein